VLERVDFESEGLEVRCLLEEVKASERYLEFGRRSLVGNSRSWKLRLAFPTKAFTFRASIALMAVPKHASNWTRLRRMEILPEWLPE
jgi:hypothetical protein